MTLRSGLGAILAATIALTATSAMAEDSLKGKLKKKASAVADAAKKEAAKTDAPKQPTDDTSAAQKVIQAKDEQKAALEKKLEEEKAKAEAKKGESKPNPAAALKAKAGKAEKKIDKAIEGLGK
jgi:hypothetical protein